MVTSITRMLQMASINLKEQDQWSSKKIDSESFKIDPQIYNKYIPRELICIVVQVFVARYDVCLNNLNSIQR